MLRYIRYTTTTLCAADSFPGTTRSADNSPADSSFRRTSRLAAGLLLTLAVSFGLSAPVAHAQGAELELPIPGGVLRGVVLDSATQAPIAGVTLRIVELNRGERTHGDGQFNFGAVPAGTYTIAAWRLGYRQVTRRVTVTEESTPEPLRILMSPTPASLQAVVVTGTVGERSRDDVLSPTSVLSSEALDRAMDGTLAATIESQPGVTLTSVGPATEKPVLRGLSGDRVLVLEDGQRPGDLSATSGDHAIAVEALTASRIEVVRGPMSLLYGSSALGGVVNVVREEVPGSLPEHAHGMLVVQGSSANSGTSAGATLTSALGRLALRGEVSGRTAGDMRTPSGKLDNTQLSSVGASAGASYVMANGHMGAAYRYYENEYGIPGGFVGSHPDGVDIGMRRHNLRMEGLWTPLTVVEDVRATVNLTDYSHEEYTKSGSVGTAFVQRLGSGELMTRTSGLGPFSSGAFGLRAQVREVRLGGATRTPNTDDQSMAAYAVQEYQAGRWRFQGGLRFDWARFEPLGDHEISVGGEHIPVRTRTFGALSGSIGTLVELSEGLRLGANVSRAYRTPDFNELYSDGPHLAAYSYDVGNPSLKEETGVGMDVFARITRPAWRAEVAAFRNEMSNYVFPRNTGEVGRQGNRPLFQYVGRDAQLVGVEGEAQVQLSPRLLLEMTASYVRGKVESRGDSVPVDGDLANLVPASRNLPLMPPLNGRVQLRYDTFQWFAGIGTRLAARQERIGDFETPTAGYAVFDVEAGIRFPIGPGSHSVTVRVENLLDHDYRTHLSRTKDVIPEKGLNAQLLYRWSF